MSNELVLWQMRKVGADVNGSEGIKFADKQYQFLELLQDLYDCNCLKGDLYTDNIVKEIWDNIRRYPEPLQKIADGFQELSDQICIAVSGDCTSKKDSDFSIVKEDKINYN
jgi:hypothetical protein